MNWFSLIIYDVYFYFYNVHNDIINNINNGIDNMIDSVLVDKVEFKCKENMEFAKKKIFFFFMNHLFLAQVICLVFLYII